MFRGCRGADEEGVEGEWRFRGGEDEGDRERGRLKRKGLLKWEG